MKRKICSLTLQAAGIILISGGAGILTRTSVNQRIEVSNFNSAVTEFERAGSIKKDPYKKFISSLSSPEAGTKTAEETDEKAIGVLYIPSFQNFSHLIAEGIDAETLKQYVGMYKDHAGIGEKGICILAAHSNVLPGNQPEGFFNRIEDYVEVDDPVNIHLTDGTTYHYKIKGIYTCIPVGEEQHYLHLYNDDREYLVLQTCTYGNSDYRTFIYCMRDQNDTS